MHSFRPQTDCGCYFVGTFAPNVVLVEGYMTPQKVVHKTRLCEKHQHLTREAAFNAVCEEIAEARRLRRLQPQQDDGVGNG